MELLIYFFIFIIGACVGSFLGVIVDRLPKGESFLKGRSHCDNCKKTLGVLDLIPVFSFIFLGGKCRFCKVKLSWFYPLIEVTTGVLFALTILLNQELGIHSSNSGQVMNYGLSIVYYLFIISSLILLFFIDLKYGILPFSIILPATIVSFLYLLIHNSYSIIPNSISAIGASLFFLILFLVTRGRGMGFGDVIYVFLMGLLLGFPKIILGLYIAFVSGALISLILIGMKKKKLRGSTIPFGPFLVAGTIISIFWGDELISLTIGILGFTIK